MRLRTLVRCIKREKGNAWVVFPGFNPRVAFMIPVEDLFPEVESGLRFHARISPIETSDIVQISDIEWDGHSAGEQAVRIRAADERFRSKTK